MTEELYITEKNNQVKKLKSSTLNEPVSTVSFIFDCPYPLVVRCGKVSEIKTILVVLNFCLDRLHHVTISRDKAHSKIYRTVNYNYLMVTQIVA